MGGYYSLPYLPNILATEKFESTKYFFVKELVWASFIFITMSYLSDKQIMSTKIEKS